MDETDTRDVKEKLRALSKRTSAAASRIFVKDSGPKLSQRLDPFTVLLNLFKLSNGGY